MNSTQIAVHERAAVALESSKAEKELKRLADSSKLITIITNAAGRQECHRAMMAAAKARTAIVQMGKAARDDANAFSKAVIAEANRLIAVIEPEESRLKALRDEWDAEAAREKASKAEAELLRVLEITQRIALFKQAIAAAARFDISADQAGVILAELQSIIIDSSFSEFYGDAKEAHAIAVAEIRATVDAKRAAEAAAAKAESDRVEAVKAAAEAARIAEQARKEEAAAAKSKAAAEAAERAERERTEAAARKVEHDKADELRRVEAEKLAAERKALDDARAKFDAEQAEVKAIEEAARKEREAKARAEQDAKDAIARAELDKIEAAKRRKQEKETAISREITNRREQIIFHVEQVEDLKTLAEIFAAVVLITKHGTKEAA